MQGKKIMIMAAVAMMSSPAMADSYIGYTNESVSKENVFRLTTSTNQKLAVRLSGEKLRMLKGKTIMGIRAAFGSKNSTGGMVDLFLSRDLGDDKLRCISDAISSTSKMLNFEFADGYVISGDEEELYLGYEMEIGARYGALSADFSKDIPGVSFAYGANGWEDLYGTGYGCANIEAIIAGDVEMRDVVVKPFAEEGYVKENVGYGYNVELFNFGSEVIKSFDAVVRVGDGEEMVVKVDGVEIGQHGTYTLALKDVKAEKEGRQDIRVEIRNVNGIGDGDVSDNVVSTSAYYYPTLMERSLLVEQFTSQTCTNCPMGHESMENAIAQTGLDVVEINHHSGYVTDIFTMKEDWTVTSLYNGTTYAPAAMVNRTITDESSSPVFETWSVSTDKAALTAAALERPYVSIALDSKYDEETRKVNLKARFLTHEEMPGEDLRYSVWLAQDDLHAKQSGTTSDLHNAVSRGSITEGAWGEKAEFQEGKITEIEKEFIIPDTIVSTSYEKSDSKNRIGAVAENMKLVVFVHQMSDTDIDGCRVFNAAEVKIGGKKVQGGFGEDETAIESTEEVLGLTYDGSAIKVGRNARFTVLDVSGRMVRRGRGRELSLADLANGVYVVRVEVDGKVRKMKIKK